MTGKTHRIIGLTVGLGTFFTLAEPTYAPATLAAVLIFSYLGSLLPDIDNSAAEIWHTIPFGHAAEKVVDPFLEHRNLTHSLLGTAILGTGLYFLIHWFPTYWGINHLLVFYSCIAAYLSHLLADSLTSDGIPIFFPLKWNFGIPPKPLHGLRIMTGKWFENWIIFPIVNICLLIMIFSNWQFIHNLLFK